MIDDECWRQVWAEMTDSELEDRLFTYLWLSFQTPNAHAGQVDQLIEEAERRGKPEMVETARIKAVAQKQILTAGLVQMATVLQLNRLELKEMINQEIVKNPVLEEGEEIPEDPSPD